MLPLPAGFKASDFQQPSGLSACEHTILTANPLGLGVVGAELGLVEVRHRQPGLAAAGELSWKTIRELL